MRKDYTHISILLDSSGSMGGTWTETIQSLESFISDQKKQNGELTLSLYTFNTRTKTIFDFQDAQYINKLDLPSPSGWTSLFDCVAISIDSLGRKLSKMNEWERPEKVLYLIFTDGEENSSKDHRLSDVRSRIDHQKSKYGWSFVLLGADFTANKLAEETHIGEGFVFNYDKARTMCAVNSLSNSVTKYRGQSGMSYDASLLDEAKKEYA